MEAIQTITVGKNRDRDSKGLTRKEMLAKYTNEEIDEMARASLIHTTADPHNPRPSRYHFVQNSVQKQVGAQKQIALKMSGNV